MISEYTHAPKEIIQRKNKAISIFDIKGDNIEEKVVDSFGDEWLKFNNFSDDSINKSAEEYFDILNGDMLNPDTYALDVGCGTGRWTKYIARKVKFVEAVDPSNAIYAADSLLKNISNVRLTKASTETLPFQDNTFDFVMSIGVLHHIPDTQSAMGDCVRKVKPGGYFYCYLYHNLESFSWFSKLLFFLGEAIRIPVSKLPTKLKAAFCDFLAVIIYMPFVLAGRFLNLLGLRKMALKMPLSYYQNKPFFMIRTDALDKFGTSLENRFSKQEVSDMMSNCGLTDIVVSTGMPYYHAVGKKKNS